MKFIAAVACQKKLLLPLDQCRILEAPPKIKELTLKRVWRYFKDDLEFQRYMPFLTDDTLPPRTFFYIILASTRPRDYADLLSSVDKERLEIQRRRDQTVEIDEDFLKAFTLNHEKHEFIKSRPIKRLVLK